MKISKKLLSLLLAVVIVVSSLSISAFAWTATGNIESGEKALNFKYTVEKVSEAPMADGTATYAGDDIYAVTCWAQSNDPFGLVTMTVHYNKAHFTPIMLYDGEMTYPQGAGQDEDTWYTDMVEGNCYVYSYGSYMNDTGMYKANGAVATTKALARYIGMGNPNHDGITTYSELLSPDHPNFAKYSAGVDTSKYGIIYFSVDVAATPKSAYFNTYHNGTTFAINTDWIDLGKLYFQRKDGVTDADVIGDVFGNTAVNSFCMDGVLDLCGTLYCTSSTTATVPVMNLVSNATIEAATSPVYSKTSQIRYDGPLANAGDATSAPFSIRSRAAMTAADFASICGTDEAAKIAITDVGFVYVANGTADVATAEAVVAEVTGEGASVANAGYYKKPVQQIQVKDGEYIWTCLIEKANYEDTASAVAYIVVNGTTYLFDAAYDTDFSVLYDTWAEKIPTA